MHLTVENVTSGYHRLPVIRDIDLTVSNGEWVSIIGPSGAGKTTLVKTIAGLLAPFRGTLRCDDRDITRTEAHERVGLGIAVVPEGRRLFAGMTVYENLLSGAYLERKRADRLTRLEAVYALFQPLRDRARQIAGSLSGGEQQMCAIGRALMSQPRLLIIDELSLGLAPVVVDRLIDALLAIRQAGTSLVVVDQNVSVTLAAADRAVILRSGRIVRTDAARTLIDDPHLVSDYFGRRATAGTSVSNAG